MHAIYLAEIKQDYRVMVLWMQLIKNVPPVTTNKSSKSYMLTKKRNIIKERVRWEIHTPACATHIPTGAVLSSLWICIFYGLSILGFLEWKRDYLLPHRRSRAFLPKKPKNIEAPHCIKKHLLSPLDWVWL